MRSETLPSACYILSDESSIPFYSTSNGYDKEEVVGKSSPPELYVMNDVYNNKINEKQGRTL